MIIYMRNKIKAEPLVSVLNIIFWTINFIFVELSLNMMVKVIISGNSGWLDAAMMKEITNDEFIVYRIGTILELILFVLIVVMLFSIITIVLFRNVQMKHNMVQLGMYRVLGYSKREMFNASLWEPITYMIIAFPLSIIIVMYIWHIMARQEVISVLLQLIENNVLLDLIAYIASGGFMILVMSLHSILLLNSWVKKGIRYMLGEGVE